MKKFSKIVENSRGFSGAKDADKTEEEQIQLHFEKEFLDKTPSKQEKLEFYHKLRKLGFDGMVIFKSLSGKL